MNLYNQCLLVLLKNEGIDCECLPHTIKEDIKHLKVTYQKLKDRRTAIDTYHDMLSMCGEIVWTSLSCDDCRHDLAWPNPIQRCDFHKTVIDWLIEDQDQQKRVVHEMVAQYCASRNNFPHLLCILEKLEDQDYCDICEINHI